MVNAISEQAVKAILTAYIDPYLKQDLVTAKAVQQIIIQNDQVHCDIVLGFPVARYQHELADRLSQLLEDALRIKAKVTIRSEIVSHAGQRGIPALPNVKNIIAVASGKGGVGKSTVAANLALALVSEGAKVGILDADIYGPSQPLMLGATAKPEIQGKNQILPVMAHGLQSMSIGYLIDSNAPMVWRGPMVSTALQQLCFDTQWENLDYLLIDLPPGTGDIQLTLAQKIPVAGAVIVTTPQDLSLLDARRAQKMFSKVNVPTLGIVENMSLHICTHCGQADAIFGSGGGEKLAAETGVELLGTLPLDSKIREQADSGKPTLVADPDGGNATRYRDIARRMAAKIALFPRDYSKLFPKIKVEN